MGFFFSCSRCDPALNEFIQDFCKIKRSTTKQTLLIRLDGYFCGEPRMRMMMLVIAWFILSSKTEGWGSSRKPPKPCKINTDVSLGYSQFHEPSALPCSINESNSGNVDAVILFRQYSTMAESLMILGMRLSNLSHNILIEFIQQQFLTILLIIHERYCRRKQNFFD